MTAKTWMTIAPALGLALALGACGCDGKDGSPALLSLDAASHDFGAVDVGAVNETSSGSRAPAPPRRSWGR